MYVFRMFSLVRVHLPLQQGLRLVGENTHVTILVLVRVHLPLQQGLRLPIVFVSPLSDRVRVHLPLQQGLRLSSWL